MKKCAERWIGLVFPWQVDEFDMYRRGEAVGIESGVTEVLGRRPRPFLEQTAGERTPNQESNLFGFGF
jgi:hypothetical protein